MKDEIQKWQHEQEAVQDGRAEIARLEDDITQRNQRIGGHFGELVRQRLEVTEPIKQERATWQTERTQAASQRDALSEQHRELTAELKPELPIDAQDAIQQRIREAALGISGLTDDINEIDAIDTDMSKQLRSLSSREKNGTLPLTELSWSELMAIYKQVRDEGDRKAEEEALIVILNRHTEPEDKALKAWKARSPEQKDRLENAGDRAAEFLRQNPDIPISNRVLAEAVYGESIQQKIEALGITGDDDKVNELWRQAQRKAGNLMKRDTPGTSTGSARRQLETEGYKIGAYWRQPVLVKGDEVTPLHGPDTDDPSRRAWLVTRQSDDFTEEIFTKRGGAGGFVDRLVPEKPITMPIPIVSPARRDEQMPVSSPEKPAAIDQSERVDKRWKAQISRAISAALEKIEGHLYAEKVWENNEILAQYLIGQDGKSVVNEDHMAQLVRVGLMSQKESDRIQRTHRVELTKAMIMLTVDQLGLHKVELPRELKKREVHDLIELLLEEKHAEIKGDNGDQPPR